MQTIHLKDDIGDLSARMPTAAEIFIHHGIDFCCSGSRSLSEACLARNQDAWEVRKEIFDSLRTSTPTSWIGSSNEALFAFIVERFHRTLKPRIATIQALLDKAIDAHGDGPAGTLGQLRRLIADFSTEIENHVQQEEAPFPTMAEGKGRLARVPVRIMQREPGAISTRLKALRKMTSDFTVPRGSCVAIHALYNALREFTDEMYRHIHLEYNILFRRVLRQKRSISLTRAN